MRRCAAVILAVALATSASFGASAGEHDSFVLRAGRILPVAKGLPEVIENGVIVVRDGRIVAIGSDVPIPPDLRVIDLPDAVVAPGLVAASGDWAGTHAGDEAVSGAYHAVDSFDRYGDYRDILATGVTTIHVNPGWHRLVAGRGAVVRLGGYHDERVLSSASDLTINLVADALGPPDLQTFLIPPSGDRGVTPQQPQRPFSRAGQLLAIREALAAAESKEGRGNVHLSMFREAWNQQSPLRIHAQRAEDIINAAAFLSGQKRTGYIVGGIEAAQAASQLAATGTRLVYTIDAPLRSTQSNLGNDPFALAGDDRNLARLAGVTFALGLSPDLPVTDLRLAGAAARRSGLSEQQVLASLTRIPAEILGVGDRVGSLAVGLEADLVAYTGHPLEVTSHVERVYTRGKLVYKRTPPPAMVVRGGTIWLGPDNWLRDGAVLVEDGRITAVGKRVPHPVGARVIDAGPDGFIAPGMIDAFGHLGLEGDRGALPANLSLTPLVGAPTLEATRVAKAGVTTVVTAPYAFDNNGSQVAAIRTYGEGRQDRIVAPTAGVVLSVRGSDAKAIPGRLNGRITAAKRYLETWQKYEKDLAEWEQKRASGQLPAATRPAEEVVTQTPSVDPVSGTWQARVFGGPLPREFEGKVAFRLTGANVEARIIDPVPPTEVRIIGTLEGTKLRGTIEADTGGMGTPQWQADLVEPDVMRGTISVQMFSVNFEARRVDKGPVEFRVERVRRATAGRDGRPLPPAVDEALEPWKAVLEKKMPVIVDAGTTQEIDAVLDVLCDEHGLAVVLRGAENAARQHERLVAKGVGVIAPTQVVRQESNRPYHQPHELNRLGIPVAFQSDAEDGARLLPRLGLYAVEQGMSAEAALASLTIDAARMFKLDHRIGSIAAGRDADLVIYTGHPFDAASRVKHVIVGGKELTP